jgi:hypothetical protein
MEKESLYNLVEENRNSRFYNDVFASLQILMNQIIKENYEKNQLIYTIIERLPKYIQLEPKFVQFFQNQYQYYYEFDLFTVNSLISIFDYFEALCWKDMQKNIQIDYQEEVPEKAKQYIISYFDKNINENKIINKDNFTSAIRKLISRMVALTRQEMGIQNSVKLKHYIINEDLWNRSIVEKDGFENEIDDIFKFDVTVGQSYKLFIALNGENILNNKLFKKKAKEVDLHMRKVSSGSENMINTDSDMKRENNENEAERRNSNEENSDNEHSESGSDDSDEEMRDDEI